MQPRDGDQVFTGRDTFDFGSTRRDAERMMHMRGPAVVVSSDPGQVPFLGRAEGRRWVAGAVLAAYWGAPLAAGIRRKRRRQASSD
jgi:dihydrodipicolinate synthase/N-acetylneuraminate lyase